MRRGLGGVLVVGLLVGGVAACSDDDGGAATGSTMAVDGGDGEAMTPADGGDDDVEAANDAVIQEYCDAVEVNNAALDASLADPADESLQDALEAASARLGAASDAVAPLVETFTPEQQAQFEECTDALGG